MNPAKDQKRLLRLAGEHHDDEAARRDAALLHRGWIIDLTDDRCMIVSKTTAGMLSTVRLAADGSVEHEWWRSA